MPGYLCFAIPLTSLLFQPRFHNIREKWIQVAGKAIAPSDFYRIFAPAIEGKALCAWKRLSMMTQAGDKWWQAPVINDDPKKDKKRGFRGVAKMNLLTQTTMINYSIIMRSVNANLLAIVLFCGIEFLI